MKQNIIVADKKFHHYFKSETLKLIDPIEYIALDPQERATPANIYNLGNLTDYQTIDYYVCLLAQARGHRVFPGISLIQDLKYKSFHSFYTDDLNFLIQKSLSKIQSNSFELSCYFGENLAKSHNDLCSKIYKVIQAPLFRIKFEKKNDWEITKIKLLSLEDLTEPHLEFVINKIKTYFLSHHRYSKAKRKNLFDVAIWIDPEEASPPSNEEAIQKFIQAGHGINLNVETITKKDVHHLLEFDALFIRETTKLNHITYRISRKAKAEGLVVIDDPDSIIKCTNKVYLEELLSQKKISKPQSSILHKLNYKEIGKDAKFPCILKKPDSAFSQGVFKAHDYPEYISICTDLFKKSDLILMQEFLFTEFDWRIGILNKTPLYACKYYMANNHWQIINNSEEENNEGSHECVSIEDVPAPVIQAALKACEPIGSSLYGVDLKESKNIPYLIEVNDNPNIDHGVEDGLLGDLLYEKIMQHFLDRCLEKRKHYGEPKII